MSIDLKSALPDLLPKAIAWAEAHAQGIATSGIPLKDSELVLANEVGVQQPGQIRISIVEKLPLPVDPKLREAALQTGLLGSNMIGLTLGYSVLICEGHLTRRILSHEFRHVYQYECCGSIAGFLPGYLQQIIEFGYMSCPLEVDARAHEVNDF